MIYLLNEGVEVMSENQEFQDSIVEGMIHPELLLACPPALVNYAEALTDNKNHNFIHKYYASEMIDLSPETNPPFKILSKRDGELSTINYGSLYSENEKQELANFATIFISLLDSNDTCDKVGVLYIAKVIAFARSTQAGNLIKNIVSEYEKNYPTQKILLEARKLIF